MQYAGGRGRAVAAHEVGGRGLPMPPGSKPVPSGRRTRLLSTSMSAAPCSRLSLSAPAPAANGAEGAVVAGGSCRPARSGSKDAPLIFHAPSPGGRGWRSPSLTSTHLPARSVTRSPACRPGTASNPRVASEPLLGMVEQGTRRRGPRPPAGVVVGPAHHQQAGVAAPSPGTAVRPSWSPPYGLALQPRTTRDPVGGVTRRQARARSRSPWSCSPTAPAPLEPPVVQGAARAEPAAVASPVATDCQSKPPLTWTGAVTSAPGTGWPIWPAMFQPSGTAARTTAVRSRARRPPAAVQSWWSPRTSVGTARPPRPVPFLRARCPSRRGAPSSAPYTGVVPAGLT